MPSMSGAPGAAAAASSRRRRVFPSFAAELRGDAERPFRGRDRDVDGLGERRGRRVREAPEGREALPGSGRDLPCDPGATVLSLALGCERGPELTMRAGILVHGPVQTIEVARADGGANGPERGRFIAKHGSHAADGVGPELGPRGRTRLAVSVLPGWRRGAREQDEEEDRMGANRPPPQKMTFSWSMPPQPFLENGRLQPPLKQASPV